MTKNIDSKKLQLIQEIAAISSEEELNQMIGYLKERRLKNLHGEAVFKKMRKTISVEDLKREQNYQGFNRAEFDRLVDELDIQEPIEDLLE